MGASINFFVFIGIKLPIKPSEALLNFIKEHTPEYEKFVISLFVQEKYN